MIRDAQSVAAELYDAYRRGRDQLIHDPVFLEAQTSPVNRLDKYFGVLSDATRVAKIARYVADDFALARVRLQGKTVVDVGCGFGIHARFYAAWGASRVIGIELSPLHTIVNQRLLAGCRRSERFEYHEASATDTGLPAAIADVVVAREAISHFEDLPRFWPEVARLLKPDGCLIISDFNNGLNRRIAARTQAEYARREGRYRDWRLRYIRQHFPKIPEDAAKRLADETSGLSFGEIDEAARRYCEEGVYPGHTYVVGTAPFNPLDRQPMEVLLDPYALCREMAMHGLRGRVYAHFGGSAGTIVSWANAVLRSLSPLTIRWARAFKIVARYRS